MDRCRTGVSLALALVLACSWQSFAASATPPAAEPAATPQGQPATLESTIEATLRHHKALKAIQENREVVRHELRRAEAGWGPRIDATGRVGVSTLSDSTTRANGGDKGTYGTSSVGLSFVRPSGTALPPAAGCVPQKPLWLPSTTGCSITPQP